MARQHLQNGENMSFWKKCPLLAAVIVSGLVIEGAGVANGVKSGEIENPASWKQPALATVFIDLKQGVYPWSDRSVQTAAMDAADVQKDRITEETALQEEDGEGSGQSGISAEAQKNGLDISETGGQANEGNGGEKAGQMENADRDADHKNGTGDKNEAGVSGNAVPGKAAEETQEAEEEPLEFTHVDKEYFADAVFIGDSRTQGLYEYSNLADVATFYSKTSLTVYNLFEKPKDFIREGDEKLTLEQALSRHQFKKVYLMIGINEMGTGTPESFFEAYARAVYKIRELQPDAIIFVQGIMRVAGQKNASDPVFNNTNINIRNVEIETLANGKDIFYIDVNEAVCDENGNLYADWTFDQIHLKAKYYQVWENFLMEHGIVKK